MIDPKIRILLAGGRKLLREGLTALLDRHEGLLVVGEAEEGAAAAKLVRALPIDVVVLHVPAKPAPATAFVQALRHARPAVGVVALTMQLRAPQVRALLTAGARGCLNEECAADELFVAIRTVRRGELYVSPRLVGPVLTDLIRPGSRFSDGAPSRDRKPLGPRQREILRRIADGQATKQIAADLGVGVKTIETHRRRLMKKLEISSVAELTKHAIREGLTTLDERG